MWQSGGFTGLGAMGASMALRVLGAGRQLVVHNRSSTAVNRWGEAGAELAVVDLSMVSPATVVLLTDDLGSATAVIDAVVSGGVELHRNELAIALTMGRDHEVSPPVTALIEQLYTSLLWLADQFSGRDD